MMNKIDNLEYVKLEFVEKLNFKICENKIIREGYSPSYKNIHRSKDIEQQRNIIRNTNICDLTYNNTNQKGYYVEILQDEIYRQQGYERISKHIITSLYEDSYNGIDGVYYNPYPPENHPIYIISEAKYGSGKLKKDVLHNKQMSKNWIKLRLEKSVGKATLEKIKEKEELGKVESRLIRMKANGDILIRQLDDNGNVSKLICSIYLLK